MKRRVGLFFFLLMAGWLVGCGNNDADVPLTDRYDSGVLHISCDESFKPVIDAQIQVYQAQNPKAKIIAHYKPEAECIDDLTRDSMRLVIMTRGLLKGEEQFLEDSFKLDVKFQTVSFDAIAVIVNPQGADSLFTLAEIKDLLTGKSKKNLIPVFDGLKATSTVRFMLDSVLRNEPLGKNVVAAESSLGVIDYVSKTKNAIGFLGVSWIGNYDDPRQLSYLRKVQLARLESADSAGTFVLPVQYLIYTKSYPLIRDLVYVLKEKHAGLANGFANFLRTDRGQLLFKRSFLFPAVRTFYIRDTELEKD
ncbi:MAG TPA: substrate-binding domain-containing protein [Flavisolibacter sp.]|nr:substrate-binding domain-containing protein [Flavisolibacter sp.]